MMPTGRATSTYAGQLALGGQGLDLAPDLVAFPDRLRDAVEHLRQVATDLTVHREDRLGHPDESSLSIRSAVVVRRRPPNDRRAPR